MITKHFNLTPRQEQIAEAVKEHGSKAAAAKALGISRSTLRGIYDAATHKGLPPELCPAPIPAGMALQKTTVAYNAHGQVEREWRRLLPDHEAIMEAIQELSKPVKGKLKAPPRSLRKTDSEDLLVELDIYDPHVGMYAEEKETLDGDYDCDIAAKRMMNAVWDLTERVKDMRPHKVVVVFGGDIMHSDTRNNRTEHSGNILDVDSRYARVVSYVTTLVRDVIRVAASVCREVDIVVCEGNHDWHSCVWLRQLLAMAYENAPNINVVDQQAPRKYLQWGDNLLGWAHGDRIAAAKFPQIVAAEVPELWGKTKFRSMHCGHIHHKKTIAPVQVDEQAGLTVRYLPALCPADAWHSSSGYIGTQKGASAFIYHKEQGLQAQLYHNSSVQMEVICE